MVVVNVGKGEINYKCYFLSHNIIKNGEDGIELGFY